MPAKRTRKSRTRTWQHVASEAKRHRDAFLREVVGDEEMKALNLTTAGDRSVVDIPAERQCFLGAPALRITDAKLQDTLHVLSTGKLSAEEVLTAFLRRCVVSQVTTNCLTEVLGERALNRAKELDSLSMDTSKPRGLLHGIPVSVKSHIGIRNTRIPAGYVAWWDHISPHNTLVVQILERAGAVVHARTTEPQGMMQLECSSNLYGTTLNPNNLNLSSGGSSGGEANLVGMGGSVIGVGSDVGGSIRVPAAACGIFGLKPTAF